MRSVDLVAYRQAWKEEWDAAHPALPAWENTWWGILLQVIILGVLMFGTPFLLWVLTAPQVK